MCVGWGLIEFGGGVHFGSIKAVGGVYLVGFSGRMWVAQILVSGVCGCGCGFGFLWHEGFPDVSSGDVS